MPDSEQTVTVLLLAMARSSELLKRAAIDLDREEDWSRVTSSGPHPGEFNRHLADPAERLALQGNVHGHLGDGREAEWQLEVLRSTDGGWLVERSLYVWPSDSDVPARRDLADERCHGSEQLAARLPGLVEELLRLRPETAT